MPKLKDFVKHFKNKTNNQIFLTVKSKKLREDDDYKKGFPSFLDLITKLELSKFM